VGAGREKQRREKPKPRQQAGGAENPQHQGFTGSGARTGRRPSSPRGP
jgi:hypothetical protein